MFCKDCGAQLNTGSRFCPRCGHAQITFPPAEPATFPDKVRLTAKKVGASPAFLIATIFLTLTLVGQLFSLLTAGNIFGSLLAESGIALPQLKTVTLAAGIIGMLPALLITIGLWITYGTCVSRKPKANTAGLTMIFVVNLVLMVFSCLALLASLLPCFYIYGHTLDSYIQSMALGAGLAILAIFVFVLIYYIKLCTTITNIRNTLRTGIPNRRVSRFIAVMCYISGGFMILGGISNLLSIGVVSLDSYYNEAFSYMLPFDYLLTAISNLLTATVQIIFGALIFSYRRKMVALEAEARLNTFQTLTYAEPYTSPVYIPPQPVQDETAEEPAEESAEEPVEEPTEETE